MDKFSEKHKGGNGDHKMKDLVKINDLSKKEILDIFKLTDKLKNKITNDLKGKTCVLYFEKPSTRTLLSFETGIYELGGNSVRFEKRTSQLARGETLNDTMRVMSRYAHCFIARVFEHKLLTESAKYSSIPIINALSYLEHPCQALTDFYTIFKHKKQNGKIVYVSDANNVSNSLAYTASKLGIQLTISAPFLNKTDKKVIRKTNTIYEKDPIKAVKGADVIYTDVWTSMGEKKKDLEVYKKYQVNKKLVKDAKKNYIFMHCLPAHRGQEVTNNVIDSKNSIVFEQAENRLHVQKAILKKLI